MPCDACTSAVCICVEDDDVCGECGEYYAACGCFAEDEWQHFEPPIFDHGCRIGCTDCQRQAWILKPHGITKKQVCLECSRIPPDGYALCPATHTKSATCALCRGTEFVEAL